MHRGSDHRQVDGSFRELAYQVSGPAFVDDELDAWVAGAEVGECVGQRPGAEAGGGTEPQPALAKLSQLVHLQPGGLDVGQDPLGEGDEHLPSRRERHVAPGSMEQLAAQLALQAMDLSAQRGLGDVRERGRPGEVAGPSDGQKVDQLL